MYKEEWELRAGGIGNWRRITLLIHIPRFWCQSRWILTVKCNVPARIWRHSSHYCNIMFFSSTWGKRLTVLRGVSCLFLEEKQKQLCISSPHPLLRLCVCMCVCMHVVGILLYVLMHGKHVITTTRSQKSNIGMFWTCDSGCVLLYIMRVKVCVCTSYVKLGVVVDRGLACKLSQTLGGTVIHHQTQRTVLNQQLDRVEKAVIHRLHAVTNTHRKKRKERFSVWFRLW